MSLDFDPNKIHLLDPKSIVINRDQRQRKIFTTDDLKASISRRGQFTPIIVTPLEDKIVLVAGERRLTTFLENPELGQIKAIFQSDLNPIQRQILELEENIRRQALSWTEEVDALLTIHELYLGEEPKWTVKSTADSMGFSYDATYRQLEIAKEIRGGNERIENATGWSTAWSILETQRERKKEHAEATLAADIASSFQGPESETYTVSDVKAIQAEAGKEGSASSANSSGGVQDPSRGSQEVEARTGNETPLILGDSVKWMAEYQGVPFNFGHFDFPYGINYQDMDQANTETHGDYDDSPEVYFELLNALCKNRDNLMGQSFHGMFWFSIKMWDETFEFFRKNAPDVWIQDVPLVWLKSDNKGIAADVHRRPRNITEFALILVRGDRKIVKMVSNAYAAPTSKVIHGSEKPVPVLRYFYQMFLDGTSRVFDPTAGSANSLVAALDYHPASMLGLEKSPEFHSRASQALKKAMTLKALEKKNG
jgi:hypothetical protein